MIRTKLAQIIDDLSTQKAYYLIKQAASDSSLDSVPSSQYLQHLEDIFPSPSNPFYTPKAILDFALDHGVKQPFFLPPIPHFYQPTPLDKILDQTLRNLHNNIASRSKSLSLIPTPEEAMANFDIKYRQAQNEANKDMLFGAFNVAPFKQLGQRISDSLLNYASPGVLALGTGILGTLGVLGLLRRVGMERLRRDSLRRLRRGRAAPAAPAVSPVVADALENALARAAV